MKRHRMEPRIPNVFPTGQNFAKNWTCYKSVLENEHQSGESNRASIGNLIQSGKLLIFGPIWQYPIGQRNGPFLSHLNRVFLPIGRRVQTTNQANQSGKRPTARLPDWAQIDLAIGARLDQSGQITLARPVLRFLLKYDCLGSIIF